MPQIGLNISISGLSGFLIIRWVRASAPLAEVGRNDNPSALTFPYDAVYTIPDLQPVVYIVQLWRSDDGVALDQLIKDWSIDASQTDSTAVINTFQYVTDRGQSGTDPDWADPADGDVILIDHRLAGATKDQLIVHEAGYGNHTNEEYDLVPEGGIELLNGKTFDNGVAWFITLADVTVGESSLDTPVSGSVFNGVAVMTANHDFDSDHYNRLILTNGAGTTLTETFPDMALIPDGTHVTFNTHRGSQNYLVLQFDAGQTVWYMGQQVNVIFVPKCQVISLFFNAGAGYVTLDPSNALRRGAVAPDYDASRNTDTGALIYADEATGVLNQSDYPGLFDFVNNLTGDAVCALGTGVGQWSYDSGGGVYPNKRKYGISGTTFRVPHLSGMVAKYSSTPGVYEADQVVAHVHNLSYKRGASDDNESGINPSKQYVMKLGSGGTNYGNDTMPTDSSGDAENKVKSYSQKPFIYL